MQRLIKSRHILLNHLEFIVNDESDVFVENMKHDFEKFLEGFVKL